VPQNRNRVQTVASSAATGMQTCGLSLVAVRWKLGFGQTYDKACHTKMHAVILEIDEAPGVLFHLRPVRVGGATSPPT
jgi:hypothetical protein